MKQKYRAHRENVRAKCTYHDRHREDAGVGAARVPRTYASQRHELVVMLFVATGNKDMLSPRE